MTAAADAARSSSRRRAGAGGSRPGRRSSTPRARSASTSTRCAAGAASAAAARSTPGVGEFPKHGIDVARRAPLAARPSSRRRTARSKGLGRRPPAVAAPPTVCGDVLIDVPPESQVHRQVVRKGLDVRDLRRSTRSSACTTSRSCRPSSRRRPATSRRLFDALEREWQLDRPRGGPRGRSARSSRRSRPATYRVTVAVHDGAPGHRASGRASTTRRSASRSTSARRPSPATSPTSPTARSSRPTA